MHVLLSISRILEGVNRAIGKAAAWLVLFMVLVQFALVVLRYVDEATLSEGAKRFVRGAFPAAAILLPVAFFLSVLRPDATEPNALIYLAYVGAVVLTAGFFVLGIGLLRKRS